jgi:ABC-2 type transport system permease protein
MAALVARTAASKGRLAAQLPGAVLPLLPLAALSIGQGDVMPMRYRQSATTTEESISQVSNLENPNYLQIGRFDLAFVFVYLYPLFILALSYDMVSAEREAGTLGLILSQPITLRSWMVARMVLRVAAIFVPVLTGVVSGLIWLGISLREPRNLAGIALAFGALLIYGVFWWSAALLVNFIFRLPSSTHALILGTLWLVVVLLLPMVLTVATSLAHPLPSRIELIGAYRGAEDASRAEGNDLVIRRYTDHPELMPDGSTVDRADLTVMLYEVGREAERMVDPIMERFDHQLAEQRRMVDRYTWLTPATSMQALLDEIAGTSATRFERFRGQVIDFNHARQAFFEPLIYKKSYFTASDLSAVPLFKFSNDSMNTTAERVFGHILAILVPAALCVLASSLNNFRNRHWERRRNQN